MGKIKASVSETLFSKTQRGVLGLLFGNPERSFYASEIMRHADAGIGTVQRELERLSAAGLLTVTRIGNQKHYQANRGSPIFEEMEAIILKTMVPGTHRASGGEAPRAAHEPRAQYVAGRSRAAFEVPKRPLAAVCRRYRVRRLGVFGSAARGEAGGASDVDLLVEFKPDAQASLFDMVRLRDELAGIFGRKVDLATAAILENPFRRRSVLKDLRELYAA